MVQYIELYICYHFIIRYVIILLDFLTIVSLYTKLNYLQAKHLY